MKKRSILIGALSLIFSANAHSQNYVPPPVSDFAMPENLINPVISYDGTLLAFGTHDNNGEEIVKIIDLNQFSATHIKLDKDFTELNYLYDTKKLPTELADLVFDPLGNLFISQDKSIVYEKRAKYDQVGRFRRVIIANLREKTSVEFKGVAYPYNFHFRETKPEKIFSMSLRGDLTYLMLFTKRGHDNYNIGEFELKSPAFKTKGSANEQTIDWTLDKNGEPIARLDYDSVLKRTDLWVKSGKDWKKALSDTDNYKPAFDLVGLSSSGLPLFVRRLKSENGKIESINPDTLEAKTYIDTNGVEIEYVITNNWNDEAVGARIGGLISENVYFDPILKASADKLYAKFQDKDLTIIAYNKDKTRLLVSVESTSSPQTFYFYDSLKDKILAIGSEYPALSKNKGSDTIADEFVASDGTKIPVYVTLPPNAKEPKNLPAVIITSAFLEDRSNANFDYLAQFIASRGFAVITPQVRGSIGFGAKFTSDGLNKWGDIAQKDIADSAKWAASKGYIDPTKVCVMGSVWGGYNALQAMVTHPQAYKCGISNNGISDVGKWIAYEHADFGFETVRGNYWRTVFKALEPGAIQKISPRRNVETISGNILLIHGLNESYVDLEQSYEMDAALKKAGKKHKYIEIPLGDRFYSQKSARETFLTEVEKFLYENLGNPNQ